MVKTVPVSNFPNHNSGRRKDYNHHRKTHWTLDYAYMSASLGTHTNTSFTVRRHIFYVDRTTQNTMSGPVLPRCSMSIFGAYLPSSLTLTHTHTCLPPFATKLTAHWHIECRYPGYARHTENAPRAGKHRPNRLAYVLPDN